MFAILHSDINSLKSGYFIQQANLIPKRVEEQKSKMELCQELNSWGLSQLIDTHVIGNYLLSL